MDADIIVIVSGVLIFLITFILAIKFLMKGVDKVKDIAHYRSEELNKVDLVVQKLAGIEIIPATGKVEMIKFYLNKEDEPIFYAVPPEYLKRLRPKLELLINQLEQNEASYGHKYAERCFFIGDDLIFRWQPQAKV